MQDCFQEPSQAVQPSCRQKKMPAIVIKNATLFQHQIAIDKLPQANNSDSPGQPQIFNKLNFIPSSCHKQLECSISQINHRSQADLKHYQKLKGKRKIRCRSDFDFKSAKQVKRVVGHLQGQENGGKVTKLVVEWGYGREAKTYCSVVPLQRMKKNEPRLVAEYLWSMNLQSAIPDQAE